VCGSDQDDGPRLREVGALISLVSELIHILRPLVSILVGISKVISRLVEVSILVSRHIGVSILVSRQVELSSLDAVSILVRVQHASQALHVLGEAGVSLFGSVAGLLQDLARGLMFLLALRVRVQPRRSGRGLLGIAARRSSEAFLNTNGGDSVKMSQLVCGLTLMRKAQCD
jgi:hypothetical protein